MVEPCATADVARSTADLLRIVARSPGQQELILTRAGRFVETLDSGQLARLAMLREVELAQERAARAAHIADDGRQYQQTGRAFGGERGGRYWEIPVGAAP